MKKSISLLLCIVMLFSMFSVAVSAAESNIASTLFNVKASDVKDNKITYTVSLEPGVLISGAVIHAEYDTDDLQAVSGGSCYYTDEDGNYNSNVPGLYEPGKSSDKDNVYCIGYVYSGETDYKIGTKGKAFVQFTFKVVNPERPMTNVKFYCYEFNSTNNPENNIKNGESQLIANVAVKTLGATEGIEISPAKGANVISWKATTGADKYRVYKKNADGDYVKIAEVPSTTTSVTDKDVKNNKSYTYTVRAMNEDGFSGPYNKAGVSFTYFNAPSKITATIKVNSVLVKWTAVEGAQYYRVYRRVVKVDGSKGSWKTLTTKTTALSFLDEDDDFKTGTRYEYTVKTFGKGGLSTHYVYDDISYVATPKVTAKQDYSGVKVTWTAVSGAVKYRVYRKLSTESKYTALGYVKGSVTSFIDKSAPSGKKLNYTVKAYTDEATSSTKGVAVNYVKAPNAVVNNYSTTGIKISWSKISGAKSYIIYRKGPGDTSWKKIKTLTKTSYIDKDVKAGKKYTYTVKSSTGSYVSAYDKTGDSIYFLKKPTVKSAVSSKTGITVKWGEVSGTTGYMVYRKSGSGEYSKIATLSGNTSVKYVDKTAKKGVTYTYAIYAYKGSSKSAAGTISCKDKY